MDFRSEFITSGLFDGGRVILRDPVFRRDPQYRDGQEPALFVSMWKVDEQEELESQRIGIGNGWTEADDGTEVTHESGKPQFNENTAAAKFVGSLIGFEPAVSWLEAQWKGGNQIRPTNVAFWNGLDVDVKLEKREFTTRDGEKAEQRYFTVTEYHGREGDGGGKVAASTPAATPASAPPAKKAVAKKAAAKKAAAVKPVEVFEPDADVLALITAVAEASENHEEFVAMCLAEVTEVGENEQYLKLVEDTGEGSVWKQVCDAYEAANS